jgi:hypothetical protein
MYSVARLLKVGILGRIDAAIARQRRGKHFLSATNKHASIEDAVFSMRSVPRLYDEDQLDNPHRQ